MQLRRDGHTFSRHLSLEHDTLRRRAKENEICGDNQLLIKGKYYLPPPPAGGDLKELFRLAATAGAGRPAGRDGFSPGPWTPDALADAISKLNENRDGVDLRTVQLWFQVNDKGISATNIRWLARVFGCDDPQATRDWQIALGKGQALLAARRLSQRRSQREEGAAPEIDQAPAGEPDSEPSPSVIEPDEPVPVQLRTQLRAIERPRGLAQRTAAILSAGSLDVPAFTFAGTVVLAFMSYLIGVQDVGYADAEGVTKQVGFLWAPNWIVALLVLLPLFFSFLGDILYYWRDEGRGLISGRESCHWLDQVKKASFTFWVIFIVTILFAGAFQWVGTRLMPLINRNHDYAPDWGTAAIFSPKTVGVPEEVVMTSLAYTHMSVSFFLYYSGLTLLYLMADDFWKLAQSRNTECPAERANLSAIATRVVRGIFRCTILGLLVAMCMKVQTFYLVSTGSNIIRWLIGDAAAFFGFMSEGYEFKDFSMPTHFTSFLVAIASLVPFAYCVVRMNYGSFAKTDMTMMTMTVGIIFLSYLLIGAATGFSIVLAVGVFLAIFGLFAPTAFRRKRKVENAA